jgi:hypothetical protein
MDARRFRDEILGPGLAALWAEGGPQPTTAASIMLLAIALQESGLRSRYQVLPQGSPGPARGWWQFERGGGVRGVLGHPRAGPLALALCERYGVRPTEDAMWRAIEGHDGLAVGLARLLLWTDPAPMPTSEADGWQCYLRCWRPGKPHPATWAGHWRTASAAVG